MKKIKIFIYIILIILVGCTLSVAGDKPEKTSSARAAYGKSNAKPAKHARVHKIKRQSYNRKVHARIRSKADWKTSSKPAKGTYTAGWRVRNVLSSI